MIVFSFFKKTLAYLKEKLSEKGLRVGKVDGDLTPEERFEKINDFRENKFDILLSSEVGSEGLDMQFCNVVINYDLPWNPMRVEQRIGRIDRIGQEADKLLIFNLCIEGTVEDRILNRLYSKLDIFESSIGELEPILGDIQATFNIQKMIDLSEEETQTKVDLKAQSIIRQKKDVVEQNVAMDAMLNDDYDFDEMYEEFINSDKDQFVQNGSEKLFLDFLKHEGVNFITLKNSIFRLNKEESKQLFEVLKHKMVEPKEKAIYTQQKRILNKLRKAKSFYFTFTKKDSHDFALEYLSLSHPLIKMVSEKRNGISYANVQNNIIGKGYAVVYREEISAHKKISTLKTLVFDGELRLIDSPEYPTFASQCQNASSEVSLDVLQSKKVAVEPFIIEKLDLNVANKKADTARLIDQKILALKEYYEKKRKYAEEMKEKVNDLDVIRMRRAQVENINQLEMQKIAALEKQKEVNGSYQILSVMKLGAS
jgi:superfamily II DNA helicase RecQ